jgi:hypothetical protein
VVVNVINFRFSLYLGAMIGWEMLEDRLAIDIYHRLVNLVKLSRQDQFLSDKVIEVLFLSQFNPVMTIN